MHAAPDLSPPSPRPRPRFRHAASLAIGAAILGAGAAVAKATPPLAGYADPAALAARLAGVGGSGVGPAVHRVEIGRTAAGRPVEAMRLGPEGVPALLVVAGLDGTHLVGPETAIRMAERLAAEHGDLLSQRAVWIVPAVNIDAIARTFSTPGAPASGTLRPVDDDRDGRTDEDGPEDLDGDGVIAVMRVRDPRPPFAATLVADTGEPRLLRAPDPLKGERPIYRVLTEGIDNDGDGFINEDGPGAVDLDRNFMHRWPEFEDGAGPYPLSEPESLALATFVMAHPEIALALTLGRHDNLAKPAEARGNDANSQIPLTIDAADVPVYGELARIFRERTGQSRAPSVDAAGSFHSWLYAQRGVPSLATVVWGRPDPSEPPQEGAPEGAKDGAATSAPAGASSDAPAAPAAPPSAAASATTPAPPASGPPAGAPPTSPETGQAPAGTAPPAEPPRRPRGGRRGGGPGGGTGGPPGAAAAARAAEPAPGDLAEDTQWLRFSDRDRAGSGFVAWRTFQHPTLGEVEIGGFTPLFRLNPPADRLDELAEKQTAFVVELIKRLPAWTIEEPTVEALSEGVHRVRLAIRNDGTLPTHTALARRDSIGDPLIVRLQSPIEHTLSGRRVERLRALAPGATQRYEWLIRGTPGERVSIVVRPPGGPDRTLTAVLAAPASAPASAPQPGSTP